MRKTIHFSSRLEAGKLLADRLKFLKPERPIVLAISPQGVPVAHPIARSLRCHLDLALGRKVVHPDPPHSPLAVVTEEDFFALDPGRGRRTLDPLTLEKLLIQEASRVEKLARIYGQARPLYSLEDHSAIIVSDGAETGVTAHAVAETARARGAREVFIVLPICSRSAARKLRALKSADLLLIQVESEKTRPLRDWYPGDQVFDQVFDDGEILQLLQNANREADRMEPLPRGGKFAA